MKITYETIDFATGTVRIREREIDSEKVLAGNALFQQLRQKWHQPGKADLNGVPRAEE